MRGGLRFAFSWSDHGRIVLGSFSDRPRIGNDVSPVFRKFLPHVGHFAWLNEGSYVTRMNYAFHFSWQAQYLVSLEKTLVAPRVVNEV